MENFQFLAKKSWYKQWWGVALIAVSCILLSFVIALSLLTWRYHNLIKQGYGEELRKNIYGETQVDQKVLAARAELEGVDRPFLGNKDASLVIVEFIDFKCPICKEQDTIIRQAIGKNGQNIKLIIRNFPIETSHPGASKLSEMAYCAFEQGLYWPAHDYLFAQQDNLTQNLTAENINAFASEIGLDSKKFNSCLVGDKTKTEVNRDYATGYKYGINGTPTFFINSYKIPGNIPLSTWEEIISKALNP
ncbi:MAG TPA: DsbA family protein [Candidatus Magasanikbacteria bacterium]|nr:DsbA family protein [Candidatus Magasanikbacteria bacterium]